MSDEPDKVRRFCVAMDEWADLMISSGVDVPYGPFADAWHTVRFAISKSCLLSRTIYGGERASRTPCPVHKGKWSGVELRGSRLINGRYHTVWIGRDGERIGDAEDDRLAAERAAGCRCFQHKGCSCTTGWQPDEHCGCVTPEENV